jgi:hypothetical protein
MIKNINAQLNLKYNKDKNKNLAIQKMLYIKIIQIINIKKSII